MSIESNIVYLEEEIKNHQERLQLMERYLKDYPAISVYKRKIRGNIYYYKKFWKKRGCLLGNLFQAYLYRESTFCAQVSCSIQTRRTNLRLGKNRFTRPEEASIFPVRRSHSVRPPQPAPGPGARIQHSCLRRLSDRLLLQAQRCRTRFPS